MNNAEALAAMSGALRALVFARRLERRARRQAILSRLADAALVEMTALEDEAGEALWLPLPGNFGRCRRALVWLGLYAIRPEAPDPAARLGFWSEMILRRVARFD